MSILYNLCALKFTFNSPVRIYGIRSVRYDSILKGQIRVLYTNYYSTSRKRLRSKRRSSPCIFEVVVSLSIRSFRTYFPQNFYLFSIRFQCKK
jgi:hypothetical protein